MFYPTASRVYLQRLWHSKLPSGSSSSIPQPAVDGGRYADQALRRRPRRRCRVDIFRDGHDLLRAVVRYGARPATPAGARRELRADRRPSRRRPLGGRVRGRRDRAAGSTRSRPGPTRSAPGATSSSASSPPGRTDLAGELSEGVLLLERGAERAERRRRQGADRARGRRARRRLDPELERKHDVALGDELFADRRARHEPRDGSVTASEPAAGRGRPAASALRRLVRAVPALVGRPGGRRARSSRGSPSSASTSSTCRRSTRSATPTARAANNALHRRARRPGLARGRSATRPAATTRSTPSSARRGRSRSLTQDRRRARDRHRARLRDPVLGRPSVAERAPRVVPPPPRRHAQVRREPAQALPGHLQRQLGLRRTGAGCGTRCSRSCSTGSTAASRSSASTTRTPSRSPFWEWLIEEVHERDRDVLFLAEAFTRRAVMRHLAKIGFSQSYTYFTWKNSRYELTEYVSELALHRRAASTSARTSSPTRPTSCTSTSSTAAGRRSRRGSCWRRRSVPSYGIYSGFENFENVAGARRAPRSTCTPRSTRSRSARSTARCCR